MLKINLIEVGKKLTNYGGVWLKTQYMENKLEILLLSEKACKTISDERKQSVPDSGAPDPPECQQ